MSQFCSLLLVLRVLVNGLQEQRILRQPLHRFHQYVEQFQSIAILLSLTPLIKKRRMKKENLILRNLIFRSKKFSPLDRPWIIDYRWDGLCSIADICFAPRNIWCRVRRFARTSRNLAEGGPVRAVVQWSSTYLPWLGRTRSRSSDSRRRSRGCYWIASSCRPRSGYSRPAGCRGTP